MADYQLTAGPMILRVVDGAMIPPDPANTDYASYLQWVLAGNTADPYMSGAPSAPPASSASADLIAQSAQSLALAQAKSMVARGDHAGAISAILQLIEQGATS
jgi:hypothetical protein